MHIFAIFCRILQLIIFSHVKLFVELQCLVCSIKQSQHLTSHKNYRTIHVFTLMLRDYHLITSSFRMESDHNYFASQSHLELLC